MARRRGATGGSARGRVVGVGCGVVVFGRTVLLRLRRGRKTRRCERPNSSIFCAPGHWLSSGRRELLDREVLVAGFMNAAQISAG